MSVLNKTLDDVRFLLRDKNDEYIPIEVEKTVLDSDSNFFGVSIIPFTSEPVTLVLLVKGSVGSEQKITIENVIEFKSLEKVGIQTNLEENLDSSKIEFYDISCPIFERSSCSSYSMKILSEIPEEATVCVLSASILDFSSSLRLTFKSSKEKPLLEWPFPINLSRINNREVFPQLFFPIITDRLSSRSIEISLRSRKFCTRIFVTRIFNSLSN